MTCKLISKQTKNKLYMTLIKPMLDLRIVSTRSKELICIWNTDIKKDIWYSSNLRRTKNEK